MVGAGLGAEQRGEALVRHERACEGEAHHADAADAHGEKKKLFKPDAAFGFLEAFKEEVGGGPINDAVAAAIQQMDDDRAEGEAGAEQEKRCVQERHAQ